VVACGGIYIRTRRIDMSSQSRREFPGFLSVKEPKKDIRRVAIYSLIQLIDTAGIRALIAYCQAHRWAYTLYIDIIQPGDNQPRWRDLICDITAGMFDSVVTYQSIPGFSVFCEKRGVKVIKLELEELDICAGSQCLRSRARSTRADRARSA
jgi:hypothetical protein